MKTSIYTQHHDHTEWINKLTFYNDEIMIMQKKLDEVNSKNTGAEIRKSIEHFQNQLLIQKNNSDNLRHHIKREEKVIEHSIKMNPVASDHRKTEDHIEERNKVDTFEKNFNFLRKEFNAFLADKL